MRDLSVGIAMVFIWTMALIAVSDLLRGAPLDAASVLAVGLLALQLTPTREVAL